ncbi:hypothetical protein ES708_11670 [subsurface metagenome]
MALNDLALVDLTQAKNYLRVDAAASLHIAAEYVGVGDDGEQGTKIFTLDNTPVEGSLQLYVDGDLQVEDTDFTISGVTITFTAAPGSGLAITASYDTAAADNTFESYDDDLLERLIEAATKKAEEYTGRAFVQGVITEKHFGDGTKVLKLYKQPVVSITSVTLDDTELTVDEDYIEWLHIGRLHREACWTANRIFTVVYTAGYGADRAAAQALVPDAVAAVLGAVAAWYENRVTAAEGLPEASKQKLDSLRVGVL